MDKEDVLGQLAGLRTKYEELEKELAETKRLLKESETLRIRLESQYGSNSNSKGILTAKKPSAKKRAKCHKSDENIEASESKILPHELMMIIADMLCDSHSYRTLGMLGLASRALHEDITKRFYQTMVCDRGWRMDWELKNGRLLAKSLDQLPLDKWKHAKFVIEDSSGSLIKNRKTYFENFALGLHKYATGSPGTIGSQLYGDVIIAKQVTRETLLRFLELPLMWDKDGSQIEWDVSPLKQISKITIEAGGEIVNDAFPAHRCCVPLLCNPRGLFARMFTIEFHRGSITDGFEDTIKHIFDMNDSLYDPMQEPETPYVKILILDGIMGLRRFISVLEPLLRQHLALDLVLEVVEWSKPPEVADNNQAPPAVSPDDEFIALIKIVRDIYARLWRNMRPYRRAENISPTNPTLFQVDVMFAASEADFVWKELSGYVEDEEQVGNPDVAPALFVAAESVDVQTRQPTPLWEDVLPF